MRINETKMCFFGKISNIAKLHLDCQKRQKMQIIKTRNDTGAYYNKLFRNKDEKRIL